ncbi:MAG: PepSY domain-containing protein [Porticoccaceae bacterium]|nr:PepSY domain-containing protein [Porticoccaceae bacterium]
MKKIISATQVKSSLDAHSLIGLCTGGLLYLICLSGSLLVFADFFVRWEQPLVAEFTDYNAQTITTAMQAHRQRSGQWAESLYVVLPNERQPRMHVSGDDKEWYLQADGSLSEPVREGWTDMLRELHYHLHLPEVIGSIITGTLGALLLALTISGIIAHPRIFKDAFRLRLGGTRRLEQADIHNRLSVWGLPFYLMIAFTGAFFGLVGPLIVVSASAFYEGDRQALIDDIYGADPVLDAPVVELNMARVLETQQHQHPQATPIFIVAHKLGTRQQFIEIAATLPGRLIYAEMYRYSAAGDYLGSQGLADGSLGRQSLYSVYRLHFGDFGNLWVRLAYGLMGLALTVIAAGGVNIWLARRGGRNCINDIWAATVWGMPLALAVSAFASVILDLSALNSFIATALIAIVFCLQRRDEYRSARDLKDALALSLLALGIGFLIRFPEPSAHQLDITMALVLAGGTLLLLKTGRSFPSLLSPEK